MKLIIKSKKQRSVVISKHGRWLQINKSLIITFVNTNKYNNTFFISDNSPYGYRKNI